MDLALSVEHLRRLRKTGEIPVKPLTVLVGRNSSGKSTLLRVFPLFRQSVMTRTSSPLLWFGDLVDFGGYDNSISDDCDGLPIKFGFKLDTRSIRDDDDLEIGFVDVDGAFAQSRDLDIGQVEVGISVSPNKDKTFISEVELRIPSYEVTILASANAKGGIDRLVINGSDCLRLVNGLGVRLSNSSIFPDLGIIFSSTSEVKPGERYINPIRKACSDAIYRILRSILDQRTKDKTVRSYADLFLRFGLPGSPRWGKVLRQSAQQTLQSFVDDLLDAQATQEARSIISIAWLYYLPRIFRQINSSLESIMRSVLYIGPARARSDRYYRYQDLSVSEIDPDGKNFPVFLNSLTDAQVENLSLWIQKLYGFGVGVEKSGGHISIFQREGDYKTNVVDAGYGISQILPVLGQLWWAQNRRVNIAQRRASQLSIIAIEQPELHLHPAHQALLADALVDLIQISPETRERPRDNRFFIETHSETFINRLGELIEAKRIDPEAIQILLFEPSDGETRTTEIHRVLFDEQGSLQNWPYGFFLPEML